MLDANKEHGSVFKEQPLVAFRHAPNLKDNLDGLSFQSCRVS